MYVEITDLRCDTGTETVRDSTSGSITTNAINDASQSNKGEVYHTIIFWASCPIDRLSLKSDYQLLVDGQLTHCFMYFGCVSDSLGMSFWCQRCKEMRRDECVIHGKAKLVADTVRPTLAVSSLPSGLYLGSKGGKFQGCYRPNNNSYYMPMVTPQNVIKLIVFGES